VAPEKNTSPLKAYRDKWLRSMDEKKDRGWQPQPIVAPMATPRLTELFTAGIEKKMSEVYGFPGHSLIITRRRLNPGLKKSSFLDDVSLFIRLFASLNSLNSPFFSSFLNCSVGVGNPKILKLVRRTPSTSTNTNIKHQN
jgi:hypothetical protein